MQSLPECNHCSLREMSDREMEKKHFLGKSCIFMKAKGSREG